MLPRGPALALITLATLAPAPLARAQGVSLRELPALARARSERQRPAQLAQLEPFLGDLRTDYRRNQAILDETITKVAALGDAVVPVLIDALTPDASEGPARNFADNAARVLARLEPRVHLATWIDLLEGDHAFGRRAAMRLIAAAGPDPRSAAALVRVFPDLQEPAAIVRALDTATALGTDALAPLAVPHLASPEVEVRAAVLDHLAASGYRGAAEPVVRALRRETENALLGRYIAYLGATARGDEAVADALVPLIEGVRLDPEDLRALIRALATIAPEGHKEARRVLLEVLERGETGAVGIEAALTLQALDEKRGPRVLFDNLDDKIRQRRGESGAFADRADAFFAFGRHKEAIRDYEDAIKYSRSNSRQAAYQLQIARCEAHRDSLPRMIRALKASGVSAATIRTEAEKDPVFLEMLGRESAQRFLESLGR